jgi:hypothetical protein
VEPNSVGVMAPMWSKRCPSDELPLWTIEEDGSRYGVYRSDVTTLSFLPPTAGAAIPMASPPGAVDEGSDDPMASSLTKLHSITSGSMYCEEEVRIERLSLQSTQSGSVPLAPSCTCTDIAASATHRPH